jgi:hypothetical protein
VVGAPHGAQVEQTGWATGPDEPLTSALHPLHGWTVADEPRAPGGTAFTRWATVPRLTAGVSGTAVYAAIAVLTAEPALSADVVVEASGDADSVEVRWADDGTVTRIAFAPLAVTHARPEAG